MLDFIDYGPSDLRRIFLLSPRRSATASYLHLLCICLISTREGEVLSAFIRLFSRVMFLCDPAGGWG